MSEEDINKAIEKWHQGDGENMELHEYLEWSWGEYCDWLEAKTEND